jgi:hypothetical protein
MLKFALTRMVNRVAGPSRNQSDILATTIENARLDYARNVGKKSGPQRANEEAFLTSV